MRGLAVGGWREGRRDAFWTQKPFERAEIASLLSALSLSLPLRRQVVTYKWLARQYAIPSNYAKK